MPELFCGFPQEPGEGPVLYPVACARRPGRRPRCSCCFQACLGLEINGPEAHLSLTRPTLPDFLEELRIHNLQVAGGAWISWSCVMTRTSALTFFAVRGTCRSWSLSKIL